ncbi:MAG TPA: HAD-IC family P-type ATPase, partial [Bacteroidia bacterium]|nr:HAD-IC family P-type ATPase [Bacteroidia bacterium]
YENLSQLEKKRWADATIFARVSPKQKLDLISVLQEKNYVVGMTGDGVNDAPALKKADIGIAMGKRGTQVAQDVADMVLKNDSFSSIILAIKQGRIIFDNIRMFVIFLLSCNMSELFVIAIVSVLNLHFQLFPLQILFINIITDVLPALALGITKGNPDVMKQPPRNINEPIIDKKGWGSIIAYSLVITACTIAAVIFSHFTVHKMETWNTELCNNILFYTLIFSQLLHVLNMSTDRKTAFFETEVFKNKFVWAALVACLFISILAYIMEPIRNILSIQEMTKEDWLISSSFGLLSFVVIRTMKKFYLIG